MYKVIAMVRKRNAIGIFYHVQFPVDSLSENEDEIKQRWFEQYSYVWELYNFSSIERVPVE